MCQHSELYFPISSVKFQVVSGLELQIFDTMEPGVSMFIILSGNTFRFSSRINVGSGLYLVVSEGPILADLPRRLVGSC